MADPVSSWLQSMIGGGLKDILGGASEIIGKFVPDPNKKVEAELELKKLELQGQQLVMDAEAKRLADVQSARAMYSSDNAIQKIFSMTFLVGYLALTVFMLWMVISWIGGKGIMLPDWCVALISTIYGTMSAKVSTIVDFFFGSSKGSHDKDEVVAQAFSAAADAQKK